MLRELYDRIAPTYDLGVHESDLDGGFPFAGYADTLAFVAGEIARLSTGGRAKILDLGIGTGMLWNRIAPETVDLTGIDVSGGMLEIARLRLPHARLIEGDFRHQWPEPPGGGLWDAVVSTYAAHHLAPAELLDVLAAALARITTFGRIVVGGTLFLDAGEREACRLRQGDAWNPEENYHLFADLLAGGFRGCEPSFAKTSYCGGVFLLAKTHEQFASRCEDRARPHR